MSNLSAYLGTFLSLISIAGTALAVYEYFRKEHTLRENIIRISIIVCVLVPIIIGGFISTSTNITVHPPSIPFVGTSPVAETSTAKPSPTPTPQVVPINQTMTCTNCPATDPDYNFSLLVKNATIDSVNSQVTLLIGVQNLSTTSQTAVEVSFLRFQDPQTGVTTNGAGGCFSSFPLAGQSTYFCRPTFQFAPARGHKYSFSAGLLALGRASTYLFSPITITF